MKIETIKKVTKYIEENITETITLDEISKLINYSPYYCSTSFREHIGKSIKSYTLNRKLQLASVDLRDSNMRIIDIAIKYSYRSQEAFSRAFTRKYSLSPYEYRKVKLPVLKDINEEVLNRGRDLDDQNEVIKHLHKQISDTDPVDVLHILNGSCMLNEFIENKYMHDNSTYLAFNEAMCWGSVDEIIFSELFIQERIKSLNTSLNDYQNIVIKSLEPLFSIDYNTIVLWFGSDMFCQINMLTILAYLDSNNYTGDVLFCMKNEIKDKMLPDAYEINIDGSYEMYKNILCEGLMPEKDINPLMYKAIYSYLLYRKHDSEINNYINNHKDEERRELTLDLMSKFPQYGLGDLQFEMMIDIIIGKK